MTKEKNYKIFVRPKENNNYIVIVLIGKTITKEWDKLDVPSAGVVFYR